MPKFTFKVVEFKHQGNVALFTGKMLSSPVAVLNLPLRGVSYPDCILT